MSRYMLVATVKDEGVNIFEWVAYHRSIGFTDIVVYENSSFDMTRRQLRLMAQLGLIQYFRNEIRSRSGAKPSYQNRAYMLASRLPEYKEVDWCMALDGDEFLNIHIGNGRVEDLVNAVPNLNSIAVPWAIFGCSGKDEVSPSNYIEQFTYCSLGDNNFRASRYYLKSIFRTNSYGRPGIHLPKDRKKNAQEHNIKLGAHGNVFDENDPKTPIDTGLDLSRIAQVNHYMVRDSKSFVLSRVRGSSSNVNRDMGLYYWLQYNWNSREDLSILKSLDALNAEKHRMNVLSKGALKHLHEKSVYMWRNRVEELLENPEISDDYELMKKVRPINGVDRKFIKSNEAKLLVGKLREGAVDLILSTSNN